MISMRWEAEKRDQRGQRLFAASKARAAGWGGVAAVAKITGIAQPHYRRLEGPGRTIRSTPVAFAAREVAAVRSPRTTLPRRMWRSKQIVPRWRAWHPPCSRPTGNRNDRRNIPCSPGADHFEGVKKSVSVAKDGGGISEPTKSPRPGARKVLCVAFSQLCDVIDNTSVEPVAMY